MDATEAIANEFLNNIGFASVVYEPDGNIPPDFLADGRVAVEVRRLNQNHDSGDGKRGLEEVTIPLWKNMIKLTLSLGPPVGESWVVSIRYTRPVRSWKELAPKIKSALIAFKNQHPQSNGLIYSDGRLHVELTGAGHPLPTYFRMASRIDAQAGGFVVAEMLSNIQYCIDEKIRKIANFRSKYREWWLVLVDRTGLGFDFYDKEQLLAHIKRPTGWDKIVVILSSDPTQYFSF
jgi:hypothetical protein